MHTGILNTLFAKVLSVFGAFVLCLAVVYAFTQDARDTTELGHEVVHFGSVAFFAAVDSLEEIGKARDEVEPYVSDPEPKAKAKS